MKRYRLLLAPGNFREAVRIQQGDGSAIDGEQFLRRAHKRCPALGGKRFQIGVPEARGMGFLTRHIHGEETRTAFAMEFVEARKVRVRGFDKREGD